ncbi:hypothetical protein [Bradyrhizobium jicamae]|uniref:hypothetical protein n=1 Tax=Bradyrhizobium jicamae TaxID=280332 RepID=UPI001BA9C029|nr:hypothetical protein [Bradyrhizobium jicamae]MBR0938183.1 hypothetical protein [Bradyrhizobium jicamae]
MGTSLMPKKDWRAVSFREFSDVMLFRNGPAKQGGENIDVLAKGSANKNAAREEGFDNSRSREQPQARHSARRLTEFTQLQS